MPLERVSPGQPSPLRKAAVVNQIFDVVNHVQSNQLGKGVPVIRAGPVQVKVRNDTGDDLPRGSVLQLGDYLLDELDADHPWFQGTIKSSSDGRIAILRKPLPQSEFGVADISGLCIARVDIQDESHTHASPVEGETYLESDTSGQFELLSQPDGTGEQELFVRFEQATAERIRIFKLTEALDAGGSAEATYYLPGTAEFSEDTIVVTDALDTFTGEIDDIGFAFRLSTAWIILQMKCAVEE